MRYALVQHDEVEVLGKLNASNTPDLSQDAHQVGLRRGRSIASTSRLVHAAYCT